MIARHDYSIARIESVLAAIAQPRADHQQERIFDLLEKFAAFNQLTPMLAKLANQINRLPQRMNKQQAAKGKLKQKSKAKSKLRGKAAIGRKSAVKIKAKKKTKTPARKAKLRAKPKKL